MSALRGGTQLVLGSAANFALAFLRNMAVARLISVADYGIASTLMIAVGFVNMATNFGFGQLAVQNRAGDDPDFIAALKGLAVARGLMIAALLFAAAGPVARLFGQGDIVWAYQAIAAVPAITAFVHPDIQRLQRSMRFGMAMLNNLGALVLTLALTWPLAMWLGDWRVMLAIYLIAALTRLVLSHAMAERPFRIGFRRDVAWEGLRFGWPLTLSAIITFAAMQGDRIIVANQFGAFELGLFSAALVLTMSPALQTADILRTFFLPVLSRVQDEAEAFDHRAAFTLQTALCIGMLAILGFALAGPPVFALVYGPRYAAGTAYVGLLGIVFGLQLIRAGTTTVAMARGHTVNMLLANLVRLAFLPVALWAALTGGTVVQVIAIGAVGQLAGLAVSFTLLYARSRLGRPDRMALPLAFGILALALLALDIRLGPDAVVRPGLLSGLACAAYLGAIASSRVLWREGLRVLRNLLRRRAGPGQPSH